MGLRKRQQVDTPEAGLGRFATIICDLDSWRKPKSSDLFPAPGLAVVLSLSGPETVRGTSLQFSLPLRSDAGTQDERLSVDHIPH